MITLNSKIRQIVLASENKRESQEHLRRVFFYGYVSGLLYNIGESYDATYVFYMHRNFWQHITRSGKWSGLIREELDCDHINPGQLSWIADGSSDIFPR